MNRADVEELYIKHIESLFPAGVRVVEENGEVMDIIFDGEKEEFFLSFLYIGRVDLYWNNEKFIFDKGRNTLCCEDTYGEIVYEHLEDLSCKEDMAAIIVNFVRVLNGSLLLEKQEIDTDERTTIGYDEKKKYVLYISKNAERSRIWTFGNIKFVCNSEGDL